MKARLDPISIPLASEGMWCGYTIRINYPYEDLTLYLFISGERQKSHARDETDGEGNSVIEMCS